MVLTKRRALRIVAADILHQHGAEYVGFYGRWSHAELPATATDLAGRHPGPVRAGVERPRSRCARLAVRRGRGVRERQRSALARPGVHPEGLRVPAEGCPQQVDPGGRRDEGQAADTRCRRGSRPTDRSPATNLPMPPRYPDQAPRSPRSSCIECATGGCAPSAHHTDVILETDTAVINQASVSGLASHPRDQVS